MWDGQNLCTSPLPIVGIVGIHSVVGSIFRMEAVINPMRSIPASQKSRRYDGSISSFDASTVSTKFSQHPRAKKNHPKIIINVPKSVQLPQSLPQSSPVSTVARKFPTAPTARKALIPLVNLHHELILLHRPIRLLNE